MRANESSGAVQCPYCTGDGYLKRLNGGHMKLRVCCVCDGTRLVSPALLAAYNLLAEQIIYDRAGFVRLTSLIELDLLELRQSVEGAPNE